MFQQSLLPSSFQTPTNSVTSSDKMNSFQEQICPKPNPYSPTQAYSQNINSNEHFFKKYQPQQQQTYTSSYMNVSERVNIPQHQQIIYNVLPPLEPISFNPNWPQKNPSPLSLPIYVPTLYPTSNEGSSPERMDQMRKDNFDLYFQNRNLKDQLNKVKQQFESMTKQYNRVSKEMDTFKKDMDRTKILQSLNANLKTQIGMVFDQLRNQRNKVEALEREIQGFKEEINNYQHMRDKEKVAYKNLLNELHTVKNQLDNIKKGPNQIFRTPNQGKLKTLQQQQKQKLAYLEKLGFQLNQARQMAATVKQKQLSKGQSVILGLEKEIKEMRDYNRGRRQSSRASKRGSEDQVIKNLKFSHQQEIGRLKRQINKKAMQAQQIEHQLLKLQE